MYDNDMYRTFSNDRVRYHFIFSFKKQNKDYLAPFNKANFAWNCGDSVSLTFTILDPDKELEGLPDYTVANITFYNFRFESIYEFEESWENPLTVTLDKETSSSFNKGIYYCSLVLNYDEETITVIPSENCVIEVM